MAKKKLEPNLSVRVISPTQAYYDGKAVSVSAVNKVGPFDVLENHANFFSLLSPGKVTVDSGRDKFEIPVTQGIIKVTNNTVTLFVDIEPSYSSWGQV